MRRLSVLLVLALMFAACGDDSDTETSTGEETVDSSTTEADSTDTSAPSDEPTPTSDGTDDEMEDDGSDPAGDADLPGERIDIFPYEGADLAVVGVDRDDTLNMRAGPGVEFAAVSELSPIATGIIATGHNRMLDDSMWVEVTADGTTGWANVSFLLQLGGTDDITDELRDVHGDLPGAETMVELATVVGERRASDEPPSRVAVIEDPEVGTKGVITVDVIGLGDDSVGGERLHIVATPITEGFVVESVQRLTLCSRGVSDDHLCL